MMLNGSWWQCITYKQFYVHSVVLIYQNKCLASIFLPTAALDMFHSHFRYTVTEGKKARLSMMHDISKDTSKGPVSAQTCLRDLARPVEHPPAAVRRREGPERPRSEALLEYHDLTDYVG